MIELYARSYKLGAWIIRIATFMSEWSHVAVLDKETNEVIEAVWPQGVIVTPFEEWKHKYPRWSFKIVDIPYEKERKVIAACRSQIGKKYDVSGIIAMPFNQRNWTDDDKWVCSELIEWAKHQAGCGSYRKNSVWRVTPEMLWVLNNVLSLDLKETSMLYMSDNGGSTTPPNDPLPPKDPPADADPNVAGGNGPRPK